MSSNMRGLNEFIGDIRTCRSREQEEKRINKELANIRSKFKDGGMNGYQKKKYICKLIYIHLLGYDVDFGHMEAVNMLSSTKYTEKQIGYLASVLLLSDNDDLIRLVINSIRKDLEDHNEVFNCLALQAIADLGSKEVAESLVGDVYKILVSATSVNFTRKKAALSLLRCYRRHPDIIPVADWAEKIIEVMDDYDLGVNCSVFSLVTALASQPQHNELFAPSLAKVINKLHKIQVEREFIPDNAYYTVPVPWLQVKILRHILLYSPPKDLVLLDKLKACLTQILLTAKEVPKTLQQNNAVSAVVLEAVNVAIHVDPESEIVTECANLLVRYTSARETNMRYLGLELLARVAHVGPFMEVIKKNQDVVILMLADKDVSVRRRAVDVLYYICDNSNARKIVTELMTALASADFSIREDIVLKIAILTERFANDYQWYVDVILQLIGTAGDNVSNDVWHRLVQIITNNPSIHQYAARKILETIKEPTSHENAVKIGGYILGEFGDVIVNEPGCSPIQQLALLQSKFAISSASTRALLISTYIKFINLFPEVKNEVLTILKQYTHALDVELQQRACEYVELSSLPSDDLLQTVFEQMPRFPERESALVVRLRKQLAEGEGAEGRRPVEVVSTRAARSTTTEQVSAASTVLAAPSKPANAGLDLLGLDVVAASPEVVASPVAAAAVEPEKIENWFRNLVIQPNGILYEDALIQIGVKSDYQGSTGKLALYFGNKSPNALNNFSVAVRPIDGLLVTTASPVPATLGGLSQAPLLMQVECVGVFASIPQVSVTFSGGNIPLLKLPILFSKFSQLAPLQAADYFTNWKSIGGSPKEAQQIVKGATKAPIAAFKVLIGALAVGGLEGIDPNPNNTVSGIAWVTQNAGKIGVLIRVESNFEQAMYRVTVRSHNDLAAAAVKSQIAELLSKF